MERGRGSCRPGNCGSWPSEGWAWRGRLRLRTCRSASQGFQSDLMLKITRRDEAGIAVIQVEGKLAGPWVKELESSWRSAGAKQTMPVRVELKARGCFTTCLIQSIRQAFRHSERKH